jgi:hypothetical protein
MTLDILFSDDYFNLYNNMGPVPVAVWSKVWLYGY